MADPFKTDTVKTTQYEVVLKRIRDIPSLPEVVNRIVEIMGNPNTPASQIADLISYDPGLTSKVLRMTNSSAYGFQRQISSVQHGIMILGFNTVRGLVLSASIFKLFESKKDLKGLDHKIFWQHSISTAIIAKLLADELRLTGMDDAFSAGMLHDIGKIVLDVYFKKQYQEVLEHARHTQQVAYGSAFHRLEVQLLGAGHTHIGGYLANKWKLPIAISEVIRFHHHPDKAENSQVLVHIVAMANELAHYYFEHFGVFQSDCVSPYLMTYFEEQFAFDAERLEGFYGQIRESLETIDDLLVSLSDV